jgi:CubicO group peptidase (beta-lactamase class C family)
LIDVFRARPLESEPGAAFSYSNSGYVVLGAVVEKVSGQPWDAFLDENVLHPAGMMDTGYDRPTLVVPRRAAGYTGSPGHLFNAAFFDISNGYAAGGLYSTVEDLYRWDRALSAGTLLGPASTDAMFTPRARVGAGRWYADGWYVGVRGGGVVGPRVAYHGGSINGFSACVARFPDDDVFVAVLSNLEGQDVCGAALGDLAPLTVPTRATPGTRQE